MRGEQTKAGGNVGGDAGSSPHARGAVRHLLLRHRPDGIIPACAGSRTVDSGCTITIKDHPRMRGEQRTPQSESRSPAGSSPHARGAVAIRRADVARYRIIPACAGSSVPPAERTHRRWDHPRMRGEQ